MKTDTYSRVMLAVIALALTAIALRPFAEPVVAQAKATQSQAKIDELARDLRSVSRTLQEVKDYGLKVKFSDETIKVSQAFGDTWRVKND